jgi:hypothetical protein
MENRGQAEEVERHIKVIVRHRATSGARAIGCDIVLLRGDAELGQVGAAKAGNDMRRHTVHHGIVGEVRARVAEGRQLPVQHRQHARLGRVEDQIVDAKVAMDDAGDVVIGGDIGHQPGDQAVHVRIAPGLGILEILLGPAVDLALEIITRTAIVAKTYGLVVDHMELRHCGVHRIEDGRALGARDAGCGRVPEDSAFDHLHDVEPGTDHAVIDTQSLNPGNGKICLCQAHQHPGLPLDRMGALEQLTRWLAAQNIGFARCHQLVGGVGLTALELLDRKRSRKAGNILGHPTREGRLIKGKAFTDGRRAEIGVRDSRHAA